MSTGNGSHAGTQIHRSPRVRVDALSYIDLGPSNGGMVIGVSESGLSFQGVLPLKIGQEFPASFRLPGLKHTLKAAGKVAWLNDSGKGGGLHFVEMEEECRSLLKIWLAERMVPEPVVDPEIGAPEEVAGNLEKFILERPAEPTREESIAELGESLVEIVRGASAPSLASTSGVLSVSKDHSAFFAAIPASPSPSVVREHVSRPHSPSETTKLVQWLVACAAAAAIIVTALVLALRGRAAPEVTVVSQSGSDSLGLKLERHGADFQVSWNRSADAVLKAVGGHLSITDGQNRKDLDLEPGELRGGSILYTPLTNDLLVRLQVVGAGSDSPVSESVRVMGGANAPQGAEKPVDRAAQRIEPPTLSGSPANPSASQRPSPVSRSVIVLDLKKPRQPRASAAPAAPPDVGSLSSAATRGIDLGVRPAAAPGRSDLAASPPASGNPLGASNAAFSSVTPPVLISGKDPVRPASAREMGVSGTVSVHFRIEKDGRVSHAVVTKGNPMLGKAAVDAVTSRRYRPATVAGNPAEAESDATFVFTPK